MVVGLHVMSRNSKVKKLCVHTYDVYMDVFVMSM